jgi:acyl-CoA reductase-like NAD-dependent aldehyde dehydrogenase
VIVHADADLAQAIPAIAQGSFAYAGQSCISVQRIIVHETLYDSFREQLVEHVRATIHTGDPRSRETVVGPMISNAALATIRARLDAAVAAGARLVHGGEVQGRCLTPTIMENVDPAQELCTQEAFAPVVTLHRYKRIEEALEMVNDSTFGLQAGLFTRDLPLAMRAFDQLEVGGVLINQVPTFRVENMPYGGVKESGFGREGVRWAMEEMSEPRSLIVKLG